jgi:hypothetical protein
MFASRSRERSANIRTAIAVLLIGTFANCIGNGPPPLHAQTPAAAQPCPSSSVLLTAKPIKGVGAATIKNACPAYLAALVGWYASHPAASVADAVAAITGTPIAPPPVVVQPPQPSGPPPGSSSVLAYDDFQSYTTTAQILAFCTTGAKPGTFWYGAGKDGNCRIPTLTSAIELDLTGGPNGSKAIRYDWFARPTCPNGVTACSNTVQLAPRLNPLPLTIGSELWIKFTDKLSPGFTAGGGGAVNSAIEYKYLFVDVTLPAPDYRTGQFQVELENALSASGTSTAVSDFGLRTKIVDYSSQPTTSQGRDYPLGMNYAGQWHTWVFGFTGIGSSAVTFVAYLDGNLVQSITGPWFPGKNIAGSILGLQLGANINNGPDQPQSRWFRELGVYTSKPSLAPMVPR